MTLDDLMWTQVKASVHRGVPWYLLASYAYYHEDDPILSDASFDALAETLLGRWREVKHPHKKLIRKADLEGGTLLLPKRKYPGVVRGCLNLLRKDRQDA